MDDFSAPSFSLGFDLDIADLTTEDEHEEEEGDLPSSRPSPDKWMDEEEGFRKPSVEESEESDVTNTLDKAQEEDPRIRVLKRLRRGPPPPPPATVTTPRLPVDDVDLLNESHPMTNILDDIEEFSSPEKGPQRFTDDYPSTQSHITCKSTKFSLLHRGFLKDNPNGKQVATKVAPASASSSTSTRLEESSVKVPFPRLTISPIRKINLLDSDSDGSPTNKVHYKKNEETDVSLKKGRWFHGKSSATEGKNNFSTSKCQKESFWKDLSPKKSTKFETPALDEFCEEYFISARDQNENQKKQETKPGFSSSKGFGTNDVIDGHDELDPCRNISGKVCINLDFSSPRPPAYRYFDHADPRIRTLVRQRLPHFVPLGNKNNCEIQQFGDITIDYMNQFNPTYSSGKAHVISEKVSRSSSSKNQTKQGRNKVIETSENWVNPRSKAAIPRDAGKRRVRADVLQAGQWFTDENGRKVYVSKDGEQSTGRTAYMKYKKEIGGFGKSKRKAAAKRSRKSKP